MIGQKNSLIQGDHIRRKNGCIVNTGAKLSRDEIRRRVAENKEQYVFFVFLVCFYPMVWTQDERAKKAVETNEILH